MALLAPTSGSNNSLTTWGNKNIIFLVGLGVIVWLGGTRLAPVVTAFLVTVIAFWALDNVKP